MPTLVTSLPNEILDIIFESLAARFSMDTEDCFRWDFPYKKDLRACSLSCKTFSGPALRILWQTLDSVLPLLKLLPNLQVNNGTLDVSLRVAFEDRSQIISF
jgi:hypothetical protein